MGGFGRRSGWGVTNHMSIHQTVGGALNLFNSEVDLTVESSGLSTGWQLVIGSAAGIALVILAFAIGGWVQRRATVRDEARRAELRADAAANGAPAKVTFTEIDLTDTDDFDIPEPAPQSK